MPSRGPSTKDGGLVGDRRHAGIELRSHERADAFLVTWHPRAPVDLGAVACGQQERLDARLRERSVQSGERIGRERDASQAVEAEGPMAEGESAEGGHPTQVGHGVEVRLRGHGGAHALVRAAGALRHGADPRRVCPSSDPDNSQDY